MAKYLELKDDVSGWRKQVTSTTAQVRVDVSKHVERMRARGGAWRRVIWRDGAWRCVGCVINRTETLSDAWGRIQSLTASRFSRVCRSAQDDLCGTFKTVIRAMFVAVMQTAVVCAVWNSLTTAVAGPEPKDDGWVMSEVQRRKAAAVVIMAEAMLKKESH